MAKEKAPEPHGAHLAGVLILVGLLLLTFLLAPGDSLVSFVSDEYFSDLIMEDPDPGPAEGVAGVCKCEPVCYCCTDSDSAGGTPVSEH